MRTFDKKRAGKLSLRQRFAKLCHFSMCGYLAHYPVPDSSTARAREKVLAKDEVEEGLTEWERS